MRIWSCIAAGWLMFALPSVNNAAPPSKEGNSTTAAKQNGVFDPNTLERNQAVRWMEETFGQKIFGVSLWQFILAFLAIVIGVFIRRILQNYVEAKLAKWFEKTKATWDDLLFDAIRKPLNAFIMVGAIHIAISVLVFRIEGIPHGFVGKSYTVGLGIIIIWAIYRLVDVMAHYLDDLLARGDTELKGQFTPLATRAMRIFIVIVGGLTVLATIGVNVNGLVGGLAVGGLAISMAASDTVANFIGTFNILTDRPYKVGDWISVGSEIDGTVEEIGFRSTRVRTFDKTQITVPNGTINKSNVKNWSRMPKRRVKMTIGVTYNTKPNEMRTLLERIEKMLREDKDVDQEYMLVQFTDFGPSSLDIFLYYFTKSTVWKEYLDVRQRINLQIMDLLEEMDLEFAFPTQTLHLADSEDDIPAKVKAAEK
ncbi:MAG: hypothetical protein CMO66_03670 [Verrucomicrobiales bacterium]|nr:hypothetical protein [Verrucomicrobiales bacterium]